MAHERDLHDFAELLLVEKLGPRTLQSLALVAEVVHGAPTQFSDPARFSFAHGGKDGHPFPVPLTIYDESIAILRRGLDAAKLGDRDKLDGMARLERYVRAVRDRYDPEASLDAAVRRERDISASLGGRTVFDDGRRRLACGQRDSCLFSGASVQASQGRACSVVRPMQPLMRDYRFPPEGGP